MNAVIGYGVLIIPIALILFAGLIVLQIFLSRAKSKIPGLILPVIYFLSSLLGVALIVIAMRPPEDSNNIVGMIPITILGSLIPANIPTAIYLIIYFLVRRKLNTDNNQEIKKMTIQDLE